VSLRLKSAGLKTKTKLTISRYNYTQNAIIHIKILT